MTDLDRQIAEKFGWDGPPSLHAIEDFAVRHEETFEVDMIAKTVTTRPEGVKVGDLVYILRGRLTGQYRQVVRVFDDMSIWVKDEKGHNGSSSVGKREYEPTTLPAPKRDEPFVVGSRVELIANIGGRARIGDVGTVRQASRVEGGNHGYEVDFDDKPLTREWTTHHAMHQALRLVSSAAVSREDIWRVATASDAAYLLPNQLVRARMNLSSSGVFVPKGTMGNFKETVSNVSVMVRFPSYRSKLRESGYWRLGWSEIEVQT